MTANQDSIPASGPRGGISRRLRAVAQAGARRLALATLARAARGSLELELPDGQRRTFGNAGESPKASVRFLDDAAFTRLLLRGEIGVGEAFVDGFFESDDLPGLVEWALLNRRHFDLDRGLSSLDRLRYRWRQLTRANSRRGSRRNIEQHYDLGNDFFSLWLDESLAYSAAVFDDPEWTLAEAQRRKFEVVCEQAQLARGQRVLEIGCGWGGFALHAAREHGCHVTAITISPQQHAMVMERVAAEGLVGQVEPRLLDYRDIDGCYDRIVSIEMLEAVGIEHLEAFFRICDGALAPGGRLFVQVISVPERAFAAQRRGVNWIQTYIFPGGVLPSLAAIERALGPTSLSVSRVRDVAADYVLTLRDWRESFRRRADEVRALGFDERFLRTWDFYLASCEAGFRAGVTADLQIVMRRPLADG